VLDLSAAEADAVLHERLKLEYVSFERKRIRAMWRKVIVVGVGVAATLLAAIALRSFFVGRPEGSHKITIAQFGDLLLYMPLYVAADEGLFLKRGLKVEIVSTGGDDKTYAAVLSGAAQFGVADPTFVAIAHERGQSGKVIALMIDGVPNYGVAATARSEPIKAPSALSGKVVATVPAPSTSYALVRKLYETAGLKPSILQVAPSGLVPSLTAGKADYALLIEPWVSAVVREGGSVAFTLMDYYPHFALTGVTTSAALLDQSPDVAVQVVEALIEATQIFYNDPALTLQIAERRFPGERREDLDTGLDRMRQDRIYPPDLRPTAEAWKPAIALRRELGDLQAPPQPMSTYVDGRIVARAHAGAGSER